MKLPAISPLRRLAVVLFLVIVLAPGAVACIHPGPTPTTPIATPTPIAHQRARIIDVLPDTSARKLEQAKALAAATIETLMPGDEIIVVRASEFDVVFSQVVPGERLDPGEVAACQAVPVGGASPHCQQVAYAQLQLANWRTSAAHVVDQVRAAPESVDAADDCRFGSGWPYQKVLQLLLSFEDAGASTLNVLIVAGDSEPRRGDEPHLPISYLAGVYVIDAPYTTSCGNPQNLQGWFGGAAGLHLFGSERPASEFPSFLFTTSPANPVAVSK